MTQEFSPINPAPIILEDNCSLDMSRSAPEAKFLNCFKIATSCCCGCVSLKHAIVVLCVFDLTLGLASAGIVFMVIEEKLEASSFLAIVCVNIFAMLLAIPILITVLKPILPGIKSRAITIYMWWKVFEVFLCPILDVYALWRSSEFASDQDGIIQKKISQQEIEKALYNEEIYEEESLPIINNISVKAAVIIILVIWLPVRLFIVYIIHSY